MKSVINAITCVCVAVMFVLSVALLVASSVPTPDAIIVINLALSKTPGK